MDRAIEIILTALYLRGAPRSYDLKRSGWPSVERSLRLRTPSLASADSALRADGLWSEALALTTPGLLAWAEKQVEAERVMTAVQPQYFPRWIERLGPSGPPAVWIEGQLPEGPLISIVGSRRVGQPEKTFALRCGAQAVDLGYMVASGGARGCDRYAARGALSRSHPHALVEVLPHGLELAGDSRAGCRISICAPSEEFSAGAAMERNTLLYALSEAAVIVHARFKTGGTWHGAVEAQRRHLTRLIVREDPSSPAHRALIGLGATALRRPEDLAEALQAPASQPMLVG